MQVLDLSHECSAQRLNQQVNGAFAWTKDDINPYDCLIEVSEDVREEFMHMADVIEANPLPTVLRQPDQFEIAHTLELMAKVKRRLNESPGVVVIDSLPLDEMTNEQAIDIFWTIGQVIGQNVAQKWEGTMVYHVRDTGAKYEYGVRGSYTSVELQFHNDNAFGIVLPHYVGLMCFRPSLEGGLSRFCSLYTIHNRLLEKFPTQLERLYRPVYWDRQAEHAEGQPIVAQAPVFRYEDGRLWTRANPSLIMKGYDVAQTPIDSETEDAVLALKEVSEDPSLWFELPIERGHLQYINNINIAHYRSEIIDHPEPDQKRHLVRSWHRDDGAVTYDG